MNQITPDQPVPPRRPAIGVFAGAAHGVNSRFVQAAHAIGQGIAAMDCSIVFGGGGLGLMGEAAQAAAAGGLMSRASCPPFCTRGN